MTQIEIDEATTVKAEVVQPTALVDPATPGMTFGELATEQGLVNQIANMEHAYELFEMRAKLITACRTSSIKATSPSDWVLFKDKQGVATAMLCASGANVVAIHYGIELTNVRPLVSGEFQPLLEKDQETGEIRYSCWFDARSKMTGQEVCNVEAGRSSTEQFIGRAALDTTSGLVKAADLRAAVSTLALTKAARILGAMVRLPLDVLEHAWTGTSKKVDDCRRGSGYGTSTDRGAQSVTSDEVKKAAGELWTEVLSRVGGEFDAAKALLKDITSNPPKFPGFDSVARLTKDWQITNAMDKLKSHQVFGDDKEASK